jgi:hypothetical protein
LISGQALMGVGVGFVDEPEQDTSGAVILPFEVSQDVNPPGSR